MKNLKKMNAGLITLFALIILVTGCQNEMSHGLGSLPNAQFTYQVADDGHTVVAVNKTSVKSIAYWNVPAINVEYLPGDTAKLNFVFPGTYKVTLLVDGRGGTDTLSQFITTTQPDPTACDPTKALGFVASCTSKTWTLLPDAGAYKVGPGPNDGSWWTSGTGEVSGRSCEFNDEYTFVFNAAGTYNYNSHGDFFSEGYMGNAAWDCEPESNFTDTQKPWGSGAFKYSIIPNAGINKLGQLKVIGLGAHMGLRDETNGAENQSGPVSSITYDILSMTQDPTGDVLVVGINVGYGWWTFTFKAEV